MIEDLAPPDLAQASRYQQERDELLRIAAVRVLNNAATGRTVDPHTYAWAQQIVRTFKPLQGPLGTGEPAQTHREKLATDPRFGQWEAAS